jgi:hypothetical protein
VTDQISIKINVSIMAKVYTPVLAVISGNLYGLEILSLGRFHLEIKSTMQCFKPSILTHIVACKGVSHNYQLKSYHRAS